MQEVQAEAKRRKIELLIVPPADAIEVLKQKAEETNAILHLTAKQVNPVTKCPIDASVILRVI